MDRERLFDYWMRLETEWAIAEREACRRNRHDLAAAAHANRWRCMDTALLVLATADPRPPAGPDTRET